MSKHLPSDVRHADILQTAVKLAKRDGFHNLTGVSIARAAKVSRGLVLRYFGNMDKMRDEVMKVAIRDEILPIVAQGLLIRHRVATKAPEKIRRQAVESLHA